MKAFLILFLVTSNVLIAMQDEDSDTKALLISKKLPIVFPRANVIESDPDISKTQYHCFNGKFYSYASGKWKILQDENWIDLTAYRNNLIKEAYINHLLPIPQKKMMNDLE